MKKFALLCFIYLAIAASESRTTQDLLAVSEAIENITSIIPQSTQEIQNEVNSQIQDFLNQLDDEINSTPEGSQTSIRNITDTVLEVVQQTLNEASNITAQLAAISSSTNNNSTASFLELNGGGY